jgi:hypothetical protein
MGGNSSSLPACTGLAFPDADPSLRGGKMMGGLELLVPLTLELPNPTVLLLLLLELK